MDVDSTAPIFRYRPLALIGRGGMAEVLLALSDGVAGKPVVLKRIWPDLVEDLDFVAMFRDEARLAIRLDHPNVVRTHELIEDSSQLAIAMEYLHGQPLAAILGRRGGPPALSVTLRLRILVDVLAGLHYAHELTGSRGAPLGVVHRDVSPENVFVTYDGQVKLVDFGVALMAGAAHRTRPGTLKGKISHAAPEYIRGVRVDRRADIFAVGVMLWELLTGRRLWEGMGEAHIVHHLATGMPIPRLPSDSRWPAWMTDVCARALAIDPDERYATAADLAHDLKHALVGTAEEQTWLLGRAVSEAFSEARVAREALIGQALSGEKGGPLTIGWAKEIDTILPTVEGFFEQTIVDEVVAPEPPPAAPARWGAHLRLGGAAVASAALAAGLFLWAQREAPLAPPLAAVPALPAVSSLPRQPVDDQPQAFAPPSLYPSPISSAPAAPTLSSLRANRHLLVGRRVASSRRDQQGDRLEDAVRREPAGSQDLVIDRLRPASVRTIDEDDPFR